MNEDEISETLGRVVPHRDVPEGLLVGARRRRRRTRALTGGAAIAVVVALAVPFGLSMGGATQQAATPAPTPSSMSASRPADGVLCPPGRTSPGTTLEGMSRGYACGPVGFPSQNTNESVQIPLSDDLIADIVREALATQRPVEEPSSIPDVGLPQFPDNVQSLVLLGPDGNSVVMSGTPDRYSWLAPDHQEFDPSWELADRIWEEIGQDDNCSVPEYLYPPEVKVDVYDAGGGTASAERVTQHFKEAGFAASNTGKSAPANMGGAIIMRGSNDHSAAMSLVATYLDTSAGGEMSKEDGVVDLLVTAVFTDESEPFAPEPAKRISDGSLECTSPPAEPTPSSRATQARWPSQTPPPTVVEQGQADVCKRDAEDRMTPTDLPNNTLPEGPVAVWLCTSAGSPREPLVGEQAMQKVIDTFRTLPTASEGGLYPAPNHAYVLVDYPDGQQYVIEVDTNASLEVRWGVGRQHIRYGGGEWFAELTELWREQRTSTPQDPPLEPVGDVCSDGDSSLRRTIDRYDAQGFLCSTDPETGESRRASLELEQELGHTIMKEAQATSVPWPDGKMLVWSGEDIVLVDDYGERLRMLHTADDTWLWWDPSGQWEWSPSPGLREQFPEVWLVGVPLVVPTPS